jgi:hypothetical protein
MTNKKINPKQKNKKKKKIIAQCYSMVKIPCAEEGDKRTQLWNKGHGKN